MVNANVVRDAPLLCIGAAAVIAAAMERLAASLEIARGELAGRIGVAGAYGALLAAAGLPLAYSLLVARPPATAARPLPRHGVGRPLARHRGDSVRSKRGARGCALAAGTRASLYLGPMNPAGAS